MSRNAIPTFCSGIWAWSFMGLVVSAKGIRALVVGIPSALDIGELIGAGLTSSF